MKGVRFAALAAAAATAAGVTGEAQAQTGFGQQARQPQQQTVPPAKQEKVFPLDSTWAAVNLNGKTFAGERPSLTVDKQYRAKGFGGCNTFSATAYPLREQRFAVGPLALTKRSCDKALMASEQAFFVALRTAAQWDIVGATLVIKGQNGELRFERAL